MSIEASETAAEGDAASAPVVMSHWEVQQRTVVALVGEAADDITSKRRIQRIVQLLAMQLLAMLHAAEAEEKQQQAQVVQESGIIVPELIIRPGG